MNDLTNAQEPDRVRRHTAPDVLDEIDDQIEQNIRFYGSLGEEAISRRIEQLDREWGMERWLETNASALALTGAVLGILKSRKWFALTCGVMGFLFQHAVTGWCPPVPLLRRLGIRTRSEIDREKYALKAIRGDFKHLRQDGTPDQSAVRQVLQTINA